MLLHIALAAAICMHTEATANIHANASTATTTVQQLPVEPSFREDCEKKGGRARVPEKWQQGPICDCGDWAAMDEAAGKCVQVPPEQTFCSPGTTWDDDDGCIEIEEENLCDSLLKDQENAYNGVNECVKAGDIFWFKCKQGYREVKVKTQGRLKRSICEVDPEAPTPPQDPCLTVGAEVCGDVRCEPYSDNSGFTCKCGIDFFFDATEKRCYNMKSCRVHKCERGLCVDQNGTFPASCQCNDYPDLQLNCREKIHKYVTSFRVNDTNSPSAEYAAGDCGDKHDMVEQAMQIVYGVSLTGVRILQCSDEYKVELNFGSEPPGVLLDKIRTCEHPDGNDDCFFPPALHIVKDSVSEQKCELYCTGPERQCVEGKCVCHVNYYKNAEGVCVHTQKKLTAVGVVLSVLIVICIGAAAVVIRRIKNRNSPCEEM
ncbi:hypothetical protein HPB52_021128 [Rhipicephalus sanguineus]|uniref:Uncharacterized protein n=1 Tax=Rhipicephalus sanguineus TaxID=34632 RepID=A0A9D4PSR6_RHISA|nr:hypothetical protein HPB52_021128 [Rhipicephalus sanguineus]